MSQIAASHILKKHIGSRRPSSWRESTITQSKEEAMNKISNIQRQLLEIREKEGHEAFIKAFAEMANQESDCSSAQNGGGGNLGKTYFQSRVFNCT
jgi:NIMA-interacting peptidyl-prolyl cis-trans isomerase 1